MAVFGRVISTLLRTAQRDGTVSAKNTYRSIKEQAEGPRVMKWMVYILLLNWTGELQKVAYGHIQVHKDIRQWTSSVNIGTRKKQWVLAEGIY